MVRELEVKKNGRRRAAASGLINFSTLSKFFFPFRRHLCSSMKKGIYSSNGMLSLPSHLSRKFYSGFIIHVWNFLLFLNWKEHFVTYFFFSLTSRRIGSLSSSACFFYFQKLFLMSSELAEIDNGWRYSFLDFSHSQNKHEMCLAYFSKIFHGLLRK